MKNTFLLLCFFFLLSISCASYCVHAQTAQTDQVVNKVQALPTQIPLPEIPPTPRSKLEIIQYVLLPFAIGAAIWLILRLDKQEREEEDKDEQV